MPLDSLATEVRSEGIVRLIARELRLHHWAKNVLLFAPPVLAHRFTPDVLSRSALAFVAFGLIASAVYVLNDVIDLEADRRHPTKRLRPLASGALPVSAATWLVPALVIPAVGVSLLLPPAFGLLLAGYFVATVVYSVELKRRVMADVIVLAGLYTARIFAGGLATGVPVSEWLATFSMFLFLSLALLKRASELVQSSEDPPRRGYRAIDREPVFAMGTGSAYLSVLVLALYVTSHEVRRLYAEPRWLWALCPLVLYWTSCLWIDARRGDVEDDPLFHAITEPRAWGVAGVGVVVLFLAT
jgi:4-hydroxybenzoate polyprenyltransferase